MKIGDNLTPYNTPTFSRRGRALIEYSLVGRMTLNDLRQAVFP